MVQRLYVDARDKHGHDAGEVGPLIPSLALDHDDFGLNQSKIMKRDRFNTLEWDAGAKPLTLLLIPL
jgi:hypothetical protein